MGLPCSRMSDTLVQTGFHPGVIELTWVVSRILRRVPFEVQALGICVRHVDLGGRRPLPWLGAWARREGGGGEPVDIDQLQELVTSERKRRGLSLRAAAAQADVPFNTLARVEKGHLPDLANFRRIVEWLGLPPERFFQPSRVRTEDTPEVIAHHLAQDPNLSAAAAGKI